ncbi:hypothetical protein A6456_32980 [Paraburkholderia tropica]|nr:hypothetical protein A6456_32980 [Paraburkholderia tropica]
MDAVWARLASRATRVILVRQDMSYAGLSDELAKLSVAESPRAVEAKVIRGTFRFTFFLQALAASQAEWPHRWGEAALSTDSWEARAAMVFSVEMAGQPWLDWTMLSNRLLEIGVVVPSDVLRLQVESGTFLTSLFLQCGTVCRFDSIRRFLDISSLNHAALMASQDL